MRGAGRTGRVAAAVAAIAALALAWPAPGVASPAGEFGPGCTGILPGAILPAPTYFSTTTGMPYVPGGAEFSALGRAPSDFTATVEYGDGASGPATISGEPSGSCFRVAAGGHAYAHSGTYSVTYAVRDVHTGNSDTLGPEAVYVWSTPAFVPGSYARGVHASVGLPWSGVVAEFSAEPPPVTLFGYAGFLDWGLEAGRSRANVTQQADGEYALTAEHTFTAAYSGEVTFTAWGAEATASAALQADAVVAPHPRPHFVFAATPVLATFTGPHGEAGREIFFRLNRFLPHSRAGRTLAAVAAFGGARGAVRMGRHERHACYTADATGLGTLPLQAGARYLVTLDVAGAVPTGVLGGATVQAYGSRPEATSHARRQLRC